MRGELPFEIVGSGRAGDVRQRVRWASVLPIAVLCTACTTTDLTHDVSVVSLVGGCFTTAQEAMFVSRECWKGSWKYCDTAVHLGAAPSGNVPGYPPTLNAYRSDPNGWSQRIHHYEAMEQPGLEADHVVIYGGLPRDTSVMIVEVSSRFDGTDGNYWMAFAVVQTGEFKGRRLLLPPEPRAHLNWKFLAPCRSDRHEEL